jgi:hypothetical protein
LIAATNRVVAQGPAANQKRGLSEQLDPHGEFPCAGRVEENARVAKHPQGSGALKDGRPEPALSQAALHHRQG